MFDDLPESTDSVHFARYLSGEASDAERQQLEAWVEADPERGQMLAQLTSVWETSEKQSPAPDVGRMWQEVALRAGIPSAPVSSSPAWYRGQGLLRFAAVLAATVGLSFMLSESQNREAISQQTVESVTVALGERSRIDLSDGTQVTLDAGSTLTYPARFGASLRQVTLEGEGYFEVASDPLRPFVVRARNARIQVLGTRFDVRAWDRGERVEVAVVEGKVSLDEARASDDTGVIIAAGQVGVLRDMGRPEAPRSVDTSRYLDWMRDEMAFDDTRLGEIVYRLERWHGVRFEFEEPAMAEERVALHVSSRSLDEVLEVIAALTGLSCDHEDGVVRLSTH